ncbi:MAG: hypothetical protein GY771_01720 [bacterium]|nr:hypothetical protein [bacterium]
MRRTDIQYWALNALEQVERNSRNEDSFVELKAKWPEHVKAARQIAGHANAARGEPILWLIGIDEEEGLVGAEFNELSEWYAKVKKEFVGEPPSIVDININEKGYSIVALYFETDNPPYLVRNPVFGKPISGPVKYEVPWREATSTQTAGKNELIKLLIPTIKKPILELSSVALESLRKNDGRFQWTTTIRGSIFPSRNTNLLFSPENTIVYFSIGDEEILIEDLTFNKGSYNLEIIEKKLYVEGPGVFTITGRTDMHPEKEGADYWVGGSLEFVLNSMFFEVSLREVIDLEYNNATAAKTEGRRLTWDFKK